MKPTNKAYHKFQDLILKSEGKALEDELGFGCRFLDICGKEYIYDGKLPKGLIQKILGQDITLERVLRALEKKTLANFHSPKTTTYNDSEDDILKYYVDYRGDLWHEGSGWITKWQLCKPAHLQEEETLLKLIEILS